MTCCIGRPEKSRYTAPAAIRSDWDSEYAHKISLVFNPKNKTYYMYYNASGKKGRGIGLLTSKPIP